jgi:hypothetical protein
MAVSYSGTAEYTVLKLGDEVTIQTFCTAVTLAIKTIINDILVTAFIIVEE